jgi:hypothetical protein
VYDLKNTMDTQSAIAENYNIDRKIIYLINWGYYFLSDGDTEYPIRSKETTQAYSDAAQQAQTDKDTAEHAISHIVYKDTDKNYYYFPSTTEAGKWAYTKELYRNSSKNAREQIKNARAQIKKNINRNNRFFELLDDFVRSVQVSNRGGGA